MNRIVVVTTHLAHCLIQNYLAKIVCTSSCSLSYSILVFVPGNHTIQSYQVYGSAILHVPNPSVTTYYVIPHICLLVLSTLHSHLLTIMQFIPSFVESHHMDLHKTPLKIPTGFNWGSISHYSNQHQHLPLCKSGIFAPVRI